MTERNISLMNITQLSREQLLFSVWLWLLLSIALLVCSCKTTAYEDQMQNARDLYNNGKYREAIDKCNMLLTNSPDNYGALYLRDRKSVV